MKRGQVAIAGALAVLVGISASSARADADIAGIAFVDSTVTGQGSKAKLPAGVKIFPDGTRITKRTGCPKSPYRTDGLIVAVIDYDGPRTAASLQVTRRPATGGTFQNAPYQIDLDPGRTVQYLGPIIENGTYALHFEYGFAGPTRAAADASFVLDRSCPGTN